ncbi:very short patch repair endonuclease [Tichowtungia aerotolerans]|uniref:Very short patch repair endonuclease n=1 Tax=Tichowtungia aerotolerans TaxID=2697043 RepID=A0A6P1M213_9BACT|nr:very short patch repair endonuclease [Tichowtungia aerotolerans]QHI68152.1 DNA mismatch endonuclease Vsr [Tichowtungia aerotolerans]
MTDHLTPEKRSWNMSRIKGKDTSPEILVRSMLHRAGYRFRKNVKTLPGKPDIVLPKYRTVIFVHGCFWHRHKGCKGATTPKTRTDWWQKKFERNIANDKKHTRELRKLGWHVLTIWECELKNSNRVFLKLEKILTTNHTKNTKG